MPGSATPTPQAEAALSPPPPATTVPSFMPKRAASSGRRPPETAVPSTSRGMWSIASPVFSSIRADQSRAPVSSQAVPAASDISDTASPVSHSRR